MKKWDFMCNVDKIVIDAEQHLGELWLPVMNFPNMSSVIEHFTTADPEILRIQTFVDKTIDTLYAKTAKGWIAI